MHAADDKIDKASYRTSERTELANLGSHDIYEWYLKAKEETEGPVCEMRYTEYPEGYMEKQYGVNPHCSWVAVSDLRSMDIWEWMFAKKLSRA